MVEQRLEQATEQATERATGPAAGPQAESVGPVGAPIRRVAVVGAGYMGGGIAQVFAMAGFPVVIADADADRTAQHLARLRVEAEDFEAQGLLPAGSARLVRDNLSAADSVAEAVADADFVEEAVLERPEIKGPVLTEIATARAAGQRARQ